MSQSTLIKKIKDEAMATVADIKTTGVAQVEAVQRETDNAIAATQKEYEDLLQKKLDNMELVALSKAKQAAKMRVQSAKRNQVNALFSEVIEEFAELSEDDYVAFFKKYAKEALPHDAKIVSVSAPSNRVVETKQIMKELGFGGEITTQTKFKAGLVIKAEDGVYDISLERMINDRRADFEIKIMQKITY